MKDYKKIKSIKEKIRNDILNSFDECIQSFGDKEIFLKCECFYKLRNVIKNHSI